MTESTAPKRRTWRPVIVRWLTAALMIALWCVFAFWVSAPVKKAARVAQVRAEISSLESALARFKSMYGIDPPSGVTLHSTRQGWDADRRSRIAIRQLWPEFDFETCGGMSNVPADGFHLNGAECLVFFLGGVIDPVAGVPTGFSKNNANPLVAKRGDYPPLFEFVPRRLVDLDQDSFREFLDPLPGQTKPYLYISSNDGQGYDPTDFKGAMRDIYRTGSSPDAKPWKPKGYQIISPGTDHEYGIGGIYDPESPDLKNDPNRTAEFDNVTNFAPKTLVEQQPTPFAIKIGLAPTLGLLLAAALTGWSCWFSLCRRH